MVKNDTSFEAVKKFINNLAYQYQVSSEVEQWTDNPLVSGSIPLPGTILKHILSEQYCSAVYSRKCASIWFLSISVSIAACHAAGTGSTPVGTAKYMHRSTIG